MFTYRWVPGGRFDVLLGRRNDGPLPVTLLGAGQPLVTEVLWFELVDLARARPIDPPGGITDPAMEPSLAPTTLQPSEVTEIWARYRVSEVC